MNNNTNYDRLSVTIQRVRAETPQLYANYDRIDWQKYAQNYSKEMSTEELALVKAAIQVAIPYGSPTHIFLNKGIAKELDKKYIHYDFLTKAAAAYFAEKFFPIPAKIVN